MSEEKYLCSPNGDMNILFDNVFGANFTRAVISGEGPTDGKWSHPFFTSRTDALLFQDIIINQLSIEPTPADKFETEMLPSDMYYGMSLSVLLKLRDEVKTFLESNSSSMSIDEDDAILCLCGLGSAGVARLYNNFNQYITPSEIATYLDSIKFADTSKLKIYVTSNGSAASQNYVFANMEQLQATFKSVQKDNNAALVMTVGTSGSLAVELASALVSSSSDTKLKQDFSKTKVYGYLFPFLTQGIEAYGLDQSGSGLSKWKTLSMAALIAAQSSDGDYYQRLPVRRSLTKAMVSSS